MDEIRVAVVHGKHLVRDGVAVLLQSGGITCVAVAESVQKLVSSSHGINDIDVFIVSVMVNGTSVEQAVAEIRQAAPEAKVIVLSEFQWAPEHLADAYAAGAAAFLTIETSPEALVEYVRLAALGARAFPAPPAPAARGEHSECQLLFSESVRRSLSEREQDILRCLASGHSNKSIARDLSITESTVKAHVRSILRKLGAENRTQAAILATSAVLPAIGQID